MGAFPIPPQILTTIREMVFAKIPNREIMPEIRKLGYTASPAALSAIVSKIRKARQKGDMRVYGSRENQRQVKAYDSAASLFEAITKLVVKLEKERDLIENFDKVNPRMAYLHEVAKNNRITSIKDLLKIIPETFKAISTSPMTAIAHMNIQQNTIAQELTILSPLVKKIRKEMADSREEALKN